MRRLPSPCIVLLLFVMPGHHLQAQDKGPTEKEKIEALVKHIENLKDASFVRNDKEYDSRTAARFLKGKWDAQQKDVKTAIDFIEKAASVSSTSGKPYLIRFKDGREMSSGEYLKGELKKLEKAKENDKP